MAKSLKWNISVTDTEGNSIGVDKCIIIFINYNKTSSGYSLPNISTDLASGGFVTGDSASNWWNLSSSSYPYVGVIVALNNTDYVCNSTDQNTVYKTLNFANGSSTIDDYLWGKVATYDINNIKHASLTGYEEYVSDYYNPIYFVEGSNFYSSAVNNDSVTVNIVLSSSSSPQPSTDPEVSYTIGSVGNINGNVTITPTSPFTVGSDGVTMVVTPNTGYSFSNTDYVSIDSDTSYDFTLQSDGTMTYELSQTIAKTLTTGCIINGTITKDTVTITMPFTTNGENGTINQTSPVSVSNTGIKFIVTPNSGYYIGDGDNCSASWTGGSVNFAVSGKTFIYTFTYTEAETIAKAGDMVIKWTFTKKEVVSERVNFYTVFLPTDDNMSTIADTVFIESGNVISVIQYFLSYKKFGCKIESTGESVLHAGRHTYKVNAPYTNKVTKELDCGEIEILEKYNNVTDYVSQLTIYLPFIGFEELDINNFMGYKMKLKYIVDIVTGKCLAEIYSNCFGEFQCVNQFSGYIARDEPISDNVGNASGSYALLTTNQMGGIIPYVNIVRSVPLEGDIGAYSGYPSNEIVKVKDIDGYVKFNNIHVSNVKCTNDEKDMIESLLTSGIIV